MDEADLAQREQERELRRLLAACAYALPRGESARECADCGQAIPETRRVAMPGCSRCIGCQEQFEGNNQ